MKLTYSQIKAITVGAVRTEETEEVRSCPLRGLPSEKIFVPIRIRKRESAV